MNKNDEEAFWSIFEQSIELANQNLDSVDCGVIASAMITAAARFGAFYAASSSESKQDLKEDKDEVVQRLGAEFKRKLAEDIADYVDNYKVYMKSE